MIYTNENSILGNVFKNIYISYIPNKDDNLKQIILKILFVTCFVTLIVSSIYLADYFWEAEHQEAVIEYSRDVWHGDFEGYGSLEEDTDTQNKEYTVDKAKMQYMIEENKDFKGWLTIPGTQLDNPIYQTDNNDYYLNHNQMGQKSIYGSLHFDYRTKIGKTVQDKNLIIYGNNMKNGSMFGSLKKFKQLDFYKRYPTLEFSTRYEKYTYKIYAVFVLNASKEDDGGYIYNIYRQNFDNEFDFSDWVDESKERSVINTDVTVELGDDILTLVTSSDEFDNARLVVMARRVRYDEDERVDTSNATFNVNARYPKKWYEHRGLEYPF